MSQCHTLAKNRFCFFFYLVTLCLCDLVTLRSSYAEAAWKELKGDHFIIAYVGDEAYAREVLRKAERYYSDIASDLGYARYSNFWQWDKRVKIMIYPSKSDFLSATGQPSWSMGSANYTDKTISSFTDCAAFLDGTLPHEIAHLFFRDFVGFPAAGGSASGGKDTIPLWIDEGVAQRQEPAKREAVKYYIKLLYDQKKLFPLKALMRPDVLALATDEQAKNFYIEAASLVGFMIEHYGSDDFAQFCRQLRDGKSLDDALRFSYSSRVVSLEGLEKAWVEYIGSL
jgi:hypothetical protein